MSFRRSMIFALVLLVVIALTLLQPTNIQQDRGLSVINVAMTTAEAAPDCDSAFDDCAWKKSVELHSCLLITGDGNLVTCIRESQAIFDGCMTAWGCPKNYVPNSPVNN